MHLFLVRTTDAFLSSHAATTVVLHPTVTAYKNNNKNRPQILTSTTLKLSKKIPEEYEKAVFIAESKTPAAQDRQIRIISYNAIAIIFLFLGVMNIIKQSGIDVSNYEWTKYVPTSANPWVGYINIWTTIFMGLLIQSENNKKEEAALMIWKSMENKQSSSKSVVRSQSSAPVAPIPISPVPVPAPYFVNDVSKSSSSTSASAQPEALKSATVTASLPSKPELPNLPPPSTVPSANLPMRLNQTDYSKRLAIEAKKKAEKERIAQERLAIEMKLERERLTVEAKRLALKAETLKIKVAKKNEEERLAMESVNSENERMAIKKAKDEFALEAQNLSIEAQKIASAVSPNSKSGHHLWIPKKCIFTKMLAHLISIAYLPSLLECSR